MAKTRTSFSAENQPANAGRPKMPADLREAFRGHTMTALNTLVTACDGTMEKVRPADRVKAAETILNRGWGTPTQLDDDGKTMSITDLLLALGQK